MGTRRDLPNILNVGGPIGPVYYNFPLRPRPKERPRFVVQGKRRFAMTSRNTREYEGQIRQCAAVSHPLSEPFQGDLSVFINFQMPSRIHGDLDNMAKAILDGMEGVVFKNDRQIKSLHLGIAYVKDQEGKAEAIVDRWVNPGDEPEISDHDLRELWSE
jgi:crossover junction endodeoxyribonuclease RusA